MLMIGFQYTWVEFCQLGLVFLSVLIGFSGMLTLLTGRFMGRGSPFYSHRYVVSGDYAKIVGLFMILPLFINFLGAVVHVGIIFFDLAPLWVQQALVICQIAVFTGCVIAVNWIGLANSKLVEKTDLPESPNNPTDSSTSQNKTSKPAP